jgi:type III restriction enzyme
MLARHMLGCAAVPARKGQRAAITPLLEAFFDGLGYKWLSKCSRRISTGPAHAPFDLVESEQRRFMAKPSYDEVVEIKTFDPIPAWVSSEPGQTRWW